MIRKNIVAWTFAAIVSAVCADAFAVAAAKKQSVIQNTTTVRTKVEAKGLYNQDCYDAYYGCMDQFCITENSNGGSCGCSDDNLKYEKDLTDVQSILADAERIATIEVEKVRAGANADIIFTGTREYDENGNLKGLNELQKPTDTKAERKSKLLALWDSDVTDSDDVFAQDVDSIMNKNGAALYRAADDICREQVPDFCAKDMTFLRQVYSRQITADCKAFENFVKTKRSEADVALAQANADVRTALKESFDAANKYDLGQCMVEFKKCMLTDDACGKDWINCVSVVAAENAQNATVSTANTAVAKTKNVYDITQATMSILDSKRFICENVLGQCVAVRDMVWPAFLKEAAPTIKVAEASAESKFRQSCLTNISNCIQTACRDDIVGKGVASMDACLSRPDMARSFCKVEIDPCERMEPLIWGYVTDKLAAMRVDACTQEVKDCFTDDVRCGSNFQNCIGMDYDFIHEMCPIDKLVVCKANNKDFSMDDLDSMLMGLYLNIDNTALDQCQELVDRRMAEVCGSTTDCNKFAADDTIGAGSIRTQKNGAVYRVTGMISFGSIKMGDASGRTVDGDNKTKNILGPGQIGIDEYLTRVRERNANVADADAIIGVIEEELNNIAGTINRTIEMIEQDPQIQFCVNGRNLSQITGRNQTSQARFPNLLNQVKMQIATAALRRAQDNYNAKFNEVMSQASKDASADVAEYMCNRLPMMNAGESYDTAIEQTSLNVPYAISYEISGISNADLVKMRNATSGKLAGASASAGRSNGSNVADTVNSFTGLGTSKASVQVPGGEKEMWSVFNRAERMCHFCVAVTTQKCTSVQKKGFLGIGNKTSAECEEAVRTEDCQDIQM